MLKHMIYLLISTALLACSSVETIQHTILPYPILNDDNLWLENVHDEKSRNWVEARNSETEKLLETHAHFENNQWEIRRVLLAKDRLPYVTQMGEYFYNFWQDDKNVRGVWRRTTLASYKSRKPRWEKILDIDDLALKEHENWVWRQVDCLAPKFDRCLVVLSRGGQDASVVREFQIQKRAFVRNGFHLLEAKSRLDWVNENTILVATNLGPESMTKSGYPRVVKLWKRGQSLAEAPVVFEAKASDVSAIVHTVFTSHGAQSFVGRSMTFFEDETFTLKSDGSLLPVQKPKDAQISAWFADQVIVTLRSDWTVGRTTFKAGSLVALPNRPEQAPSLIFSPNDKQSVSSVLQTEDVLIVTYLDAVQGKVARAYPSSDGTVWKFETLPFPANGDLSTLSTDAFGNRVLVHFEGFLSPPSIISAEVGRNTFRSEKLRSLPSRFNAFRFEVDQLWAKSRDGTMVPYFLVHPKNLQRNQSNPVLIYGYGGFELSMTPFYLGAIGKVWLEKGGSFALTNIRGGGEFGPHWHSAALKENRQKAFDDFAAVAEDLIVRQLTRPAKMAAMGGSNGGLLVGATFVQRPELFKAVVSQVPLLDMLRYNQLLAGASWEAEYGDPNDPKMRDAILKYSPYQNVKRNKTYPDVFFLTSTLDDRVHPGHARKMTERMRKQGHRVMYFENTEGGHGAAANLEQKVRMQSLIYTFLQSRLLNP